MQIKLCIATTLKKSIGGIQTDNHSTELHLQEEAYTGCCLKRKRQNFDWILWKIFMPPILAWVGISASRIRLLCSSREQNRGQYSESEKSSQQYKGNIFSTVRVAEIQCRLPQNMFSLSSSLALEMIFFQLPSVILHSLNLSYSLELLTHLRVDMRTT